MATNHTENYRLNLWEPSDSFLRTEFNENSNKIDAALGTLSETAATHTSTLSSHTATLNNHSSSINTLNAATLRIHCGSYTGNGNNTRTFTFPFRPKLVLFSANRPGGLIGPIIEGQTQAGMDRAGYTISWSGNSVTLTAASSVDSSPSNPVNSANSTYYYFIIG